MLENHTSLPAKEFLPVVIKAIKSKAFRAWFVPLNDGISVSYWGGAGETATHEEVFLPGVYGGAYAFEVELKALKAALSADKRGSVKLDTLGGTDGCACAFKVGQGASSLSAYRDTLDDRNFKSVGIIDSAGDECANPQDFLALLKAWVPWLKTARESLRLVELHIDEFGVTALASDGHGLAKLRLAGSATHASWFRSEMYERETEGEGDEIVIHLPLKAVERLVDIASLVKKGVTDLTLGLTDDRTALQVKVGNYSGSSKGDVHWSCLSFDLVVGCTPNLMAVSEMHQKSREYEPDAYLVASLDDRFARSLSDALAYRRIPDKAAKDLKCFLVNDIMLFLRPAEGAFGDNGSLANVSAAHQHIRFIGKHKLDIHLYNSVSLGRSDVNLPEPPEPVQAMMTIPCERSDKALGSKGRLFRIVANNHSQAKLYAAIAVAFSILPAETLVTDGELVELSSTPGSISCQILVKPQLVRD